MKEYVGKDKHKIALFEPMTGATAQVNGEKGLVPAPLIADRNKFLRGDGTWADAGSGTGTITDVNVNGVSVVVDGVAEIDLSGYAQSVDLATVATSGDYTDLINKPTIPDELADLMDDSTHRVVTDTQISTWNAKSDFSGSYNDLTDKPTLGTASAKDYTASVTQNSNDLVTSGAVFSAIDNLPVPMIFKGTLGTGGTITALPTASISNEGYTYKVITAGTYASQSADIGDVFVSNGTDWVLIPAGDETFTDTWREIKVDGVSVLGSSINTGALNLKSGINMGIAVDGNTLTFSATDTTYSDATQSVHGLMSTSDKIKLDGIESGAEVNVQSDWNQTTSSAKDFIKNKPNINNGTLTIQKNGTTIQTFSANQSESATANITLTKSDVGLGNVDNTADANKNVNSATRLTKTETVLATDSTPYVLRQALNPSNFSGYIREKIVGGSIAWNQIIPKNIVGGTYEGITFTNNNDGSWTLTGIASSRNAFYNLNYNPNSMKFLPNHIYYIGVKSSRSGVGVAIVSQGGFSAIVSYADKVIKVPTSEATATWCRIQVIVPENTDIGTVTIIPMAIDLTLMFGSTIADYIYNLETATAGTGIAKLKECGFFTKDYYNYDAGSIQNVCTSEKRIVGFNQWDEQWEIGAISYVNGTNIETGNRIRSVNYIPCIPGEQYYFMSGSNIEGLRIVYYDYAKNFMSSISSMAWNSIVIIPQNARYMRFCDMSIDVSGYNNDICINISDPVKNGTYEPYHVDTIPLSSEELRGIPKLDANNNLYYDGDEYASDGKIKRKYSIVDLGTLDWTRNTSYTNPFFITSLTSKSLGDLMASKYYAPKNVFNDVVNTNNSMCIVNNTLRIRDDAYTDTTIFKTTMSGVYLVYELAEPTEETTLAYQNPQYTKDGTEEFVDGLTRDMIVPVGHVTEYMGATTGEYQYIPTMPVDSGKYNLVTDGYYMGWEKQKKPWILASAFTMKWGENKKHDIDNLKTIYYNIPIDDADSMKTRFAFHWYNINEDTEGEYVYEVDATSLYNTSYGLTIPTANWDYKYINITIDKVYIESGLGTIDSGCRLAVQVYYRFEYRW